MSAAAPRWRIGVLLATWLFGGSLFAAETSDWPQALKAEIERIDQATPGNIGVYVKRLDNGETLSYQADRAWYLGSAVKLPIAIAVLQEVEAGKLSLSAQVKLEAADRIDGSGSVVWQKPGRVYRIDALLKSMLMVSDNTAANMLVRTLGEDTLNRRAKELLGSKGFTQITNFTRIRQDVYAELHPAASRLTAIQLVQLAAAPIGPQRVTMFERMLAIQPADLKVPTLDQAYANYYQRGLNAAPLEAYGAMLEKLVRGKLLAPDNMKSLYTNLKFDTYDAYRLEAGLPKTVRFIHKTGTQYQRACHTGVIDPQDGGVNAIVVVVCAEGLDEHKDAAPAFEAVGRAITKTVLAARDSKQPR